MPRDLVAESKEVFTGRPASRPAAAEITVNGVTMKWTGDYGTPAERKELERLQALPMSREWIRDEYAIN